MFKYWFLVLMLDIFMVGFNYDYIWHPATLSIKQHQFSIHYLKNQRDQTQKVNAKANNTGELLPMEFDNAVIINHLTNSVGIKVDSLSTKMDSINNVDVEWFTLNGYANEGSMFDYLMYLMSGELPLVISSLVIKQQDDVIYFHINLVLLKHYQLKPTQWRPMPSEHHLFCQKNHSYNQLLLTQVPISSIAVTGYLQQGDLTTALLSSSSAHALVKTGDLIGLERMRIQAISTNGLQLLAPNQKSFYLSYPAKA